MISGRSTCINLALKRIYLRHLQLSINKNGIVKWYFVLTCVLVQRNTQIERKKELTPRSFTFHSVILDKTRKICTKLSSYVIYVGASVNWVRFVSTGIQSPIGPPVFLRERERARGEERRKSLSCCSGNLPFHPVWFLTHPVTFNLKTL